MWAAGFWGGAALDREEWGLKPKVDPDFRPRRGFVQGGEEKW